VLNTTINQTNELIKDSTLIRFSYSRLSLFIVKGWYQSKSPMEGM